MKSGASDPFADDDSAPNVDPDPEPTPDDGGDSDTTVENADSSPKPSSDGDDGVSDTGQLNRSDLPYTLRRDKVKDERDSVHQLFVQDDTDATERDARRDIEDRFEEDVYKLDAREAIYLAGMRNVDDAEEILREWGYDL